MLCGGNGETVMAKLLKGKEVAAALNEQSVRKAAALKEKGITPTLAIL